MLNQYLVLHPKLCLRKDEDVTVLYLVSFLNNIFFTLHPKVSLALSMLDGRTDLQTLESSFSTLFPEESDSFFEVIQQANRLVAEHVDLREIGLNHVFLPNAEHLSTDGIFVISDRPIERARDYDPRQFVGSQSAYVKRLNGERTKNRLSVPLSLLGFFTNRCQTDCIYCYAERRQMPEMPYRRWLKILDEMVELNIKMFNFGGGDVLSYRRGVDFVLELCERRILFLLSTKSLISLEDAHKLAEVDIQKPVDGVRRPIQISIDAADSSILGSLTGRKSYLDRISLTIDNLLHAGIAPRVKSVLLSVNFDQPKDIVDLFYKKGVRNFSFTFYSRSFFRHKDDYFIGTENARIASDAIESLKVKYPDAAIDNGIADYHPTISPPTPTEKTDRWKHRVGCSGGRTTMSIAANGQVVLCEQIPQCEPFVVGDLSTQSIMQVWNSPEMEHFVFPSKQEFSGTVCADCEDFVACQWTSGTCFRDTYFAFDRLRDAPPLCPRQVKDGLRIN